MRNKKSVLMTLNHNYGCFSGVGSGIAGNGWQLTEVGDYEAQNLNIKIMFNRSRNVDITTEPPILVRCCYVPFFFINLN